MLAIEACRIHKHFFCMLQTSRNLRRIWRRSVHKCRHNFVRRRQMDGRTDEHVKEIVFSDQCPGKTIKMTGFMGHRLCD